MKASVVRMLRVANPCPDEHTRLIVEERATMSSTKRIETRKTCCESGKGEFVFYACEADRWLFVEKPYETWFEMHILCDTCSGLFRRYRLVEVSQRDQESHWKLKIPMPDQVPCYP